MCRLSLKQLLFLLTFLKVTNGMSTGGTHCGEKSDNCVMVKECAPFMDYINTLEKPLKPSTVEFLKSQQCGFQEGYPKVCCSVYSYNLPTSTEPSIKRDYPICRVKSECILLKHCRPFMDLIKSLGKPLTPSVVSFLRAQQCGFQEGLPKVCCSLLPKSIHLKHARPHTKPLVNKAPDIGSLFVDDHTVKPSTKRDLLNIIDKVATVKPSKPTMSSAKLKEKADAINKAFEMSDLFDFTGSFDLFRRKRYSTGSEVDVEIR